MTELTLIREPSKDGATLSVLYLDAYAVCDVLEDEIREVPGVEVVLWKVKGRTAIPSGTYMLALQNSMRFGADTLTVTCVPGFEYIRIHGGNTQLDTEGCLLPGIRNSENTVKDSRACLQRLRDLVVPAIKRGEPVTIGIINPAASA